MKLTTNTYTRLMAGSFAAALLMIGTAYADTINVAVYTLSSSTAGSSTAATAASVTATGTTEVLTATITNTTGTIDMCSDEPAPCDNTGLGGYTIGGYLTSEAPFGTVAITSGAGAEGDDLDNTLWVITGTTNAPSGTGYSITDDDGVSLNINGTVGVVYDPGPQAADVNTGTYTGASNSSASFTLYYVECCGAPAELITTLAPAVSAVTPEPSSVALFGTGLAAMVFGFYRRKRVS